MEDFNPPTLDLVMSAKESRAAVLLVKFSHNGEFLAISYDNEHKDEDPNKTVN